MHLWTKKNYLGYCVLNGCGHYTGSHIIENRIFLRYFDETKYKYISLGGIFLQRCLKEENSD